VGEKYNMDGGYKNFIVNASDKTLFERNQFPRQK
jgi:hypothetical protein